MGCIGNGKVVIIGNFAPVTKNKPKDPDADYKVMVPYRFEWREKIGSVECNCKEVLECYQAYYGWDWYHSDSCALVVLVKNKPQLLNLWCYSHLPFLASAG